MLQTDEIISDKNKLNRKKDCLLPSNPRTKKPLKGKSKQQVQTIKGKYFFIYRILSHRTVPCLKIPMSFWSSNLWR